MPTRIQTPEKRLYTFSTELRAASDSGDLIFVGHAAPFNRRSNDLGYFIEQIAPGAFAKSIREDDIIFTINHDPSKILARTKSGTLTLSEDSIGLLAEATLAPSYARDLEISMRRGDVSQMSFVFETRNDFWETDANGNYIRTLLDVKLYDVSVVTIPAYPDTDAALRCFET